ncbi:LysR family transcriptional regulator substrate-binding protein, partial [Acinetobacter pittii]|uniref:LysR family transcriptional regulator substrate-binding protein n=1 Tax=Acinetobacter pittii TaxID=48296 RepID=UPI00281430DE
DTLGLTVLPTSDEFETVPLASCERYVWVAADDPLARQRALTVHDLEGRKVALVGKLFKNYGLLEAALEREGVRPAEITTSSEMMWLHQYA